MTSLAKRALVVMGVLAVVVERFHRPRWGGAPAVGGGGGGGGGWRPPSGATTTCRCR